MAGQRLRVFHLPPRRRLTVVTQLGRGWWQLLTDGTGRRGGQLDGGRNSLRGLFLLLVFLPASLWGQATSPAKRLPGGPDLRPSRELLELEKLQPLADPLPKPGPNDWMSRHKEYGETFDQYVRGDHVRKTAQRKRIAICLLGDFTPAQEKVLATTMKYLECFYTVPVEVQERVSIAKVPELAQRKHPQWGDHQILTKYVLNDLLKPKCPDDALAYLCFTASDLYPDDKWNFVYGQASLSLRIGVWSIYRNGDPAESDAAYRLCLARTMKVASHETGHILGLVHCQAFHCNMIGVNNRDEGDRQPFHFCPVCLRKLCWNLQVKPADYLLGLETFCREHEFSADAERYQKARELLPAAGKGK